MNVCIFCSSNDLEDKYVKPAKELARSLATAGHNMIYGSSDYGLMKVMADGMQQGGAKIVGITIPVYAAHARENADEMIIAKTLGERKATALERSDAIVVLIGGLGTLDELTEILELKRQDHHEKPIIVLDTDGFYDGLKMQLQRMAGEHFFKPGENTHIRTKTLSEFIQFVDTPSEVMKLLGDAGATSQAIMEVTPKQKAKLETV